MAEAQERQLMTNKVLLVTSPDDVLDDGLRILMVGLTNDQTNLISQALTRLGNIPTIVGYIVNGTEVEWFLDKKPKCDLIIFNADSENDVIIGYMAAQSNSYYFGNLKSLSQANQYAIYDSEQIFNLLENAIEHYGRKTR